MAPIIDSVRAILQIESRNGNLGLLIITNSPTYVRTYDFSQEEQTSVFCGQAHNYFNCLWAILVYHLPSSL